MINPESPIQALRVSKVMSGRSVLREIDLELTRAECVALMGDNGAGKTTLLRCLAGLARPSSGEIRWFGEAAEKAVPLRRHIGMVGHQTGLYVHLTVRENLLFTARMSAVKDPALRVDDMLDQVELRATADQQVRHLSRGTRQRLALARALIHRPLIVLLDEPFSGLDAAAREWLATQVHVLRTSGCAVCFTTHDPAQARQLADRTLVLQSGRIASGPVAAAPLEHALCRSAG